MSEPLTTPQAEAWIAEQLHNRDPYWAVAEAGDKHRETHGCDVFASTPGHQLAVMAAAVQAKRVLEIGGGFGYGALWLAQGVGPGGRVETLEKDPVHAEIIRGYAIQYDWQRVITVLEGNDADVLPTLSGPYDLIVYDAYIPGPGHIPHFERLLRRGGTLMVSNLFLGRFAPDLPELGDGAAFRQEMLNHPDFHCAFSHLKLVAVKK